MGDKTKGLYGKFIVRRTDGRDHPGEKHDGCEYFVLDLSHDPHAYPALMAYAASCSEDYPLLASDLRAKAMLMREAGVIPETIQELRDVEERMSAAADELARTTQKLASQESIMTYSNCTDGEFFRGEFATTEDAAVEAFRDNPDIESVEVGENHRIPASFYVSAERILEDVYERISDECGEVADDWIDGLMRDSEKKPSSKSWLATGSNATIRRLYGELGQFALSRALKSATPHLRAELAKAGLADQISEEMMKISPFERRQEYERNNPDAERGPGHETHEEQLERWREGWRKENMRALGVDYDDYDDYDY